jgi:hypothetical protein
MPTAAHLPSPQPSAGEATGELAGDDAKSRIAGVIDRNSLLIVVLTACAAILASSARSATGPDTWYSLMAGRLIWNNGLPHHDSVASLTLGRTWVDQEWLGHLGIYGLLAAGGWALALLTGVVGYTAAFAVSAVGARVRGGSERAVAIVVLVAFVTSGSNTELRAQTFAYVLFALTLLLLLGDDRAPSRRVYLTLPLLVVWANVHGSVLLGAALVTLYGVISAVRAAGGRRPASRLPRAVALILLPWTCVLASPYGLALPGYYRRVLGNSAIRRAADEWGRSTPGNEPVFFVLLAVAIVVAAVAARRGFRPLFPLAVLASTAVFGLIAVRNVVWFALAIAAILPIVLDVAWPTRGASRSRNFNLLVAGFGLVFVLGVAAWVGAQANTWVTQKYPPHLAAATSRAASADAGARILADEAWADWLLYEDPSLAGRIAYDIRYELLTEGELDRILAFQQERGPHWQTVASPFPLLVLDRGADAGAVKWFRHMPNTVVVANVDAGAILRQAQ